MAKLFIVEWVDCEMEDSRKINQFEVFNIAHLAEQRQREIKARAAIYPDSVFASPSVYEMEFTTTAELIKGLYRLNFDQEAREK